MLDGQQIVAGADPGTAIDNGLLIGTQGLVARMQLRRRPEQSLSIQIVYVRGVDRAGDMTGYRVQRFGLATEPGGRARIKDHAAIVHMVPDRIGIDQSVNRPWSWLVIHGFHWRGWTGLKRAVPSAKTPVQQRCRLSQDAQQVDQPTRAGALLAVICHHGVVPADACLRQTLRKRLWGGKRVPTVALPHRCGGQSVTIDQARTGKVTCLVGLCGLIDTSRFHLHDDGPHRKSSLGCGSHDRAHPQTVPATPGGKAREWGGGPTG